MFDNGTIEGVTPPSPEPSLMTVDEWEAQVAAEAAAGLEDDPAWLAESRSREATSQAIEEWQRVAVDLREDNDAFALGGTDCE